jgi:hypothetical protein
MSTQAEIDGLGRLMTKWTTAELEAFFCCVRSDDSVPVPTDRETLMSQSVEESSFGHTTQKPRRAPAAPQRRQRKLHMTACPTR